MFEIFKSDRSFEPLDHNTRKYFENNMLWLEQEFPEPPVNNRKIFMPIQEDFPIKWNKSEDCATKAMNIIAENMQLNHREIAIDFYDETLKEFDMGSSILFLEPDSDAPEPAGLYHLPLSEDGKFQVSINRALLNRSEALIATLAHELAHVKLLGQKGLQENDEYLTDLTTVFFGFGIFNANVSFQYYQGIDKWGFNTIGYLKQEEWAYALALLAFMRNEDKPGWSNFLNGTIKKDFEKSLKYLFENSQSIFLFDEE